MKTMKLFRKLAGLQAALAAIVLLGLASGCGTDSAYIVGRTNDDSLLTVKETATDILGVGESVNITLSDTEKPTPPIEDRIKDDGTITLPLIGAVKAAGKTPGELQRDIHDLYVPKYYVRLAVNVRYQNRVYYVGGEVRNNNRFEYFGQITVTKAIQSAGGFTDFAKKSKVQLTRASGKTFVVDCVKALKNSRYDPPVFPGDTINVPRRW